MKIACLIKPHAPIIYFLNKINEFHDIEFVVCETKRKLKNTNNIINILRNVKRILLNDSSNHHYLYNRYFENKWHEINKSLDLMVCNSVNSNEVLRKIRNQKIDLLLVYGTSIVKDYILNKSKLALNLHWGLSPYYRGTNCTKWALVNWDPYNIGVTIHRISSSIDGGDIVAQKRISINSDDTSDSINMRLSIIGTELMIKVLDKMKNGENINFIKQDLTRDCLTLNRQWSPELDKHIMSIYNNNLVEKMLAKPARKEKLRIVEI
jgi:methionyl-tRNA formyltransferase